MTSQQIKYINHSNETIQFGENGLYVQENELHNYKWEYTTGNNQISKFSRGIVEKKINIVIVNPRREKAVEVANKLMEYTEKDILAKKPGRLYFNDFYMNCYLVGSNKKDYDFRKGILFIELIISTDMPVWIREISKTFSKTGGSDSGKNLDFPYGQPFDFASGSNITEVNNIGFMPCDFKIVIYGQESNPSIYIGGHNYQLDNCNILKGEYLTIDSKNKTILLTQKNGTQISKFNCRNKESYIFEKIPNGVNSVTWADDFKFDVVLYEERSEPKWI